jgi:glycine hydroxymethyltransferase
MAFELFVHPESAVAFWNGVLKAGEQFGVKPIGLGARDSLRTEAGLAVVWSRNGIRFRQRRWLWLGDMEQRDFSGTLMRDLGVAEGGFGSYVKTVQAVVHRSRCLRGT